MKASDGIEIVLVAVVGYVVYRLLDAATGIAKSAADAVANPIADAIIRFTLPEPVGVTGAAILPNGKSVSLSSIDVNKTAGKEEFWFSYAGHVYQLGPRSVQGNYPTRLLK